MYTVEVTKFDRRYKKRSRLVLKKDYQTEDKERLENLIKKTWPSYQGYSYKIHRTFVEKVNYMSGEKYMERYDTPYFASPSSETYWNT